jgi:hypothetical protein
MCKISMHIPHIVTKKNTYIGSGNTGLNVNINSILRHLLLFFLEICK